MRQVPHYLLIGGGRVATHFRHYFSLLQLPFSTWQRSQPLSTLHAQLAQATHVLLLISDKAITEFALQHLLGCSAIVVHFSGALYTKHAYGAHPLMTFGRTLYDQAKYESIPFVVDEDALPFDQLLPGLPNPHVSLDPAKKAKYHALCVMSGNFSCLLWQKLITSFESDFHFPAEVAHPYLLQQAQNLVVDHQTALTGPLVRGDHATIEKNLTALQGDPFREIYENFVKCYQAIQDSKLDSVKEIS